MDRDEELEFLELLDSIPQPPVYRAIFMDNDEVTIMEPLLTYITEQVTDAKIYDGDKMKRNDWEELASQVDLSGSIPMIHFISPPTEIKKPN